MKESFELEEIENNENDLKSKFNSNKNSNFSFITNNSNNLNDNKKSNEKEFLNNKNNNNYNFLKSLHSINKNNNKNIEKEENKCLSFFFKFFYVFRERSLTFQVSIFYSILIIIFIIILLSIKISKINSLFETHSDKNYYSSIVNDMINIERKIKNNIDNYNTIDYYLNYFNINLFFEIYSKILIKNKLLLEENLFKNITKEKDFFKEINESFILSENLENLIKTKNNIYIKNLIPFYYKMTPIFYQYLLSQNINLSNIFFIGYYNESDNKCNEDYMYFKYPIDEKENSIKIEMKNNKIFDLFLEPYTICNENDIEFEEEKEEIYKKYIKYNYYNLLEQKNYSNKTIIINKKSDKNYKYIININRFFENINNKNINFAIVVKIKKNNNTLPFINYDNISNIKNYDFFSILNLFGNEIYPNNNNLPNENYDINNENNFIIHQPLFIENIFNYGFTTKNENKIILKFSELNNIEKSYHINYYIKNYDYKFTELIYFLNYFLNNYSNNSNFNYPSKNINEYYSNISKKYSCFNDYCFYNNCDLKSKLFIEPEKLNFMPNCYCIPLYCKYSNEDNNDFHKKILKKLNNINDKYDYTFTSNKEDFIKEKENYFNFNEYYNRKTNSFQCKISFVNKNFSENDFNVDVKNLNFFSFGKIFLFSFHNNENIKNLIKNFNKNTNKNKYILFFIYFILLIFSSVFLLILLIINLKKISEKMKKVKKLRTKIISNNIINNFNKNFNSFEEIILSKKKKNEKNYNKNDFDELDTLIKFINDNINDFTIEFNINNNNSNELNNIKNQYNQILKVNEYKNKIINNYDINNQNSVNINNIENLIDSNEINSDENEINTSEIYNKKYMENNLNNIKNKNNEKENISLNLINEFLSLFSKEINFENIKSNFYYTNKNTISNLKSNLNYFSDTEGLKNEITTFEQLNNSINYYKTFINNFWKKKYFEEKQFE